MLIPVSCIPRVDREILIHTKVSELYLKNATEITLCNLIILLLCNVKLGKFTV